MPHLNNFIFSDLTTNDMLTDRETELVEDYQRKINSVNELLKNKNNDEETINLIDNDNNE